MFGTTFLSFIEQFESAARRHADAIAVRDEDREVTYAELADAAGRVSAYLEQRHPRGTVVAVEARRSVETVIGLLGVLGAGLVYLPVNPRDPAHRRADIFELANVCAALTAVGVPDVIGATPMYGFDQMLAETPRRFVTVTPEDPAYLLFTSGSTGQAKGVLGAHGGIVNLVSALVDLYQLTEADVTLQFAALTWDTCFEEMLPCLVSGGQLVFRTDETIASVPAFEAFCSANDISIINVPTAFWVQWAEASPQLPPAVRVVTIGGEAVPTDVVRRWHSATSSAVQLVNTYGLTEATAVTTAIVLEPDTLGDDSYAPIGRPLAGVGVHLVDEDGARVTRVGREGEIVISGAGLALGYVNPAADSARRFRVDPATGQRTMHTGDLAIVNESGCLVYRGRLDRQIKVRGIRVEPAEIEASLRRQPEVADALVVQAQIGKHRPLIALVTPADRAACTPEAVLVALASQLPTHLVPARVFVVDEIPLLPNGKVDYAAATAIARERLRAATTPEVALPDNHGVVDAVVTAASSVLGFPVSASDQWLALGGDSISSIRLATTLLAQGLLATSAQIMGAENFWALSRELGTSTSTATAPAALTTAITGRLALTPMQQGILFEVMLTPGAQLYFDQDIWRIDGDLDTDKFQEAWRRLITRHSALRASFHWDDADDVYQMIHADAPIIVAIHDFGELDAAVAQARLDEFLVADLNQHLDMERPPLMRLALLRTGPSEHYFVWSVHRLVLDGWSTSVALNDLIVLYDSLVRGCPANLPDAMDYATYVAQFGRIEHTEAARFWSNYLAGVAGPTPLPGRIRTTDRTAASGQHHRYVLHSFDQEVEDALTQVCRTMRVTSSTIFRAAWGIAMSRYSGDADITFGVTMSGRPSEVPNIESSVGLFINSLPLRIRVDLTQSVADMARAIQRDSLAISRYELTSQSQIQHWAGLPGARPLFESLIVYQNYPGAESYSRTGAVKMTHLAGFEQIHYPLSLIVRRVSDRLTCEIWYDDALLDADVITFLLAQVTALIEAIAAGTEMVGDLPPLGAAETDLLLRTWNSTSRPVDPATVVSGIGSAAATWPDAAAVEDATGAAITYRELWRAVRSVAHRLRGEGVKAGDVVALHTSRSVATVVGMLGTMYVGAAYTVLAPEQPVERLRLIVDGCAAALILTEATVIDADLGARTVPLGELISDQDMGDEPAATNPDGVAYVVYTSGSTGQPKGVLVPHRALANVASAMVRQYELCPGERMLHGAAVNVDFCVGEIFPALLAGATVVIRDPDAYSDLETLRTELDSRRIDVISIPTALWHELASEMTDVADLGGVRLVDIGGERANPAVVRRWQRVVDNRVVLLNSYGPTEATFVATACRLSGPGVDVQDGWNEVPIGRPIANTECYVLDAARRPVPRGAVGELYLGGRGVALGYLGDLERTAEAFVPNQFTGQGTLYRTGDMARYLPDGNLEFLGRSDRQIKVRGHRVELGEVEAAIASHDTVRHSVVVPRRDDSGAVVDLIAYVVLDETDLSADEASAFLVAVKQHTRLLLPRAFWPSRWVLIDAVPVGTSGKVDLAALPLPDMSDPTISERALSEVEVALVGIWTGVVGRPVGVDDDFFEVGGNSLLSVRLVARIRRELGADISVATLFRNPTVASVAELLAAPQAKGLKT